MNSSEAKKPKHKSTKVRLDNIEHYLMGQAPFLNSYDPTQEYPKIEPVVDPLMIPAPPPDAPVVNP